MSNFQKVLSALMGVALNIILFYATYAIAQSYFQGVTLWHWIITYTAVVATVIFHIRFMKFLDKLDAKLRKKNFKNGN